MSKQKSKPANEAPEQKPASVASSVQDFAESQRENAPEETADDLARKALGGGASEENKNAEQLSTDANAQPQPAKAGEIRDRAGELFNPELHAVKSDGSPSFAKSGLFRRRRGTGGRVAIPATPAISSEESRRIAEQQAAAAEEQKRRKAMIAAQGISEIIFKSGYMLGGDEWLPIKNDEKQIDERRDMHTAWAEYCYARGVEDIPPGMLVAFVCSAYMLPRFAAPETQKRLGAFATFLKRGKLWFENWRLSRKERKDAARITNGNDRERQNDSREGDSVRAKEA